MTDERKELYVKLANALSFAERAEKRLNNFSPCSVATITYGMQSVPSTCLADFNGVFAQLLRNSVDEAHMRVESICRQILELEEAG